MLSYQNNQTLGLVLPVKTKKTSVTFAVENLMNILHTEETRFFKPFEKRIG